MAEHRTREETRTTPLRDVLSPGSARWCVVAGVASALVGIVRVALVLAATATLTADAGERRATLIVAAAALLLVEAASNLLIAHAGRVLEFDVRDRVRSRMLRASDAWFRRRASSDLAERSHQVHVVRLLPELGARVVTSITELIAGACALVVLDASLAVPAAVLTVGSVAVYAGGFDALRERDAAWHTTGASAARSLFDALRAPIVLRAHAAEGAWGSWHAGLLRRWSDVGREMYRQLVVIDTMQLVVGLAVGAAVAVYAASELDGAASLAAAYLSLRAPLVAEPLGRSLASFARPQLAATRIADMLDAPAENEGAPYRGLAGDGPGMAIEFRSVGVSIEGRSVLEAIHLDIEAGSIVGITGPSGAGKSTLIGTLLGWWQPTNGRCLVDRTELTPDLRDAVRRETAWVAPEVQLWNRSFEGGLEAAERLRLVRLARSWWAGSTILLVSHDRSELALSDSLVVVVDGHVVERGRPAELAANPTSWWTTSSRVPPWEAPDWRHLTLAGGRLASAGGDA